MVTRVSSKMIDGIAEEIASKFDEVGITGVVSEWDEQEAETTDKAMAPAAVVGATSALASGGASGQTTSGKGGDGRVRVTVW